MSQLFMKSRYKSVISSIMYCKLNSHIETTHTLTIIWIMKQPRNSVLDYIMYVIVLKFCILCYYNVINSLRQTIPLC